MKLKRASTRRKHLFVASFLNLELWPPLLKLPASSVALLYNGTVSTGVDKGGGPGPPNGRAKKDFFC